MNTLQVILIALFIYLGAIGSIVGNTLGWYCVGRPLIAAFVVGLIMGDMSTAMLVGIPLQIATWPTSRQVAQSPGTCPMPPILALPWQSP